MEGRYADSRLTVDLAALGENYQLLKDRVSPAETAAVVKANAYGLGSVTVTKQLAKQGCRLFFVAQLEEALELREAGIQQDIAVFHGVQMGQEAVFDEHGLIPVLNNLGQIQRWNEWAKNQPGPLPAIIHTDTGMNRLGLDVKDVEA